MPQNNVSLHQCVNYKSRTLKKPGGRPGGLETRVKFFPAEQFGGVSTVKALAAPYTKLKFMPTGGVNKENLESYLSCDKVIACGGSWMVKKDLIEAGEFDKIRQMTKETVAMVAKIRRK